MSDYTSHIILVPQEADWRWYETLRPYITAFKTTVTKSADDAGSFHGAQHTVTILHPPGEWPDGIVPFFKTATRRLAWTCSGSTLSINWPS